MTMNFEEAGTGEPILLVHGGGLDLRSWREVMPHLATRHRIIAVDLRYFGAADWPDDGSNFSIQTHANDLADFIRLKELAPANVVGWSYSGGVTLTAAVQNPGVVKSLFLYEPSIANIITNSDDAKAAMDDRMDMLKAAAPLVEAGNYVEAISHYIDGLNGETGKFDRMPPWLRDNLIWNSRVMRLSTTAPPSPPIAEDDLRALDIPVDLVIGERAGPFFRISAETAHRFLPHSEITVVPDARHAWPIEAPADFSQMVIDFVKRT